MLRKFLAKDLSLYPNGTLVKDKEKPRSNLFTTHNNSNDICIKFKLNKACIVLFSSVHLVPHAPLLPNFHRVL